MHGVKVSQSFKAKPVCRINSYLYGNTSCTAGAGLNTT